MELWRLVRIPSDKSSSDIPFGPGLNNWRFSLIRLSSSSSLLSSSLDSLIPPSSFLNNNNNNWQLINKKPTFLSGYDSFAIIFKYLITLLNCCFWGCSFCISSSNDSKYMELRNFIQYSSYSPFKSVSSSSSSSFYRVSTSDFF